MSDVTILVGDARQRLAEVADQSVQTCVTSPPYFGLRDYGHAGQMGLEQTPEAYVAELVGLFREVRRVLKDDGTVWLNLGDSYARQVGNDRTKEADSGMKTGSTGKSELLFKDGCNTPPSGLKPKDLIGIPWRVAFALQADGWYLRQDIIWHKPNPMPESVRDRCTKAHEYLFLLSKSEKYYFDAEAIKEPSVTSAADQVAKRNKAPHKGQRDAGMRETTGGFDKLTKIYETRNRRSVWTITTKPYRGAHFATFPPELVEPCILAGSRPGDIVLDPFGGSGTTGMVAAQHGRDAILCELNESYVPLMEQRIGVLATTTVAEGAK